MADLNDNSKLYLNIFVDNLQIWPPRPPPSGSDTDVLNLQNQKPQGNVHD